jgi:hypothetical protein
VRSMLCYIVNVTVCVTFSFLKRGGYLDHAEYYSDKPAHVEYYLTHLLVLEIFSGGSDHRDYTATRAVVLQSI